MNKYYAVRKGRTPGLYTSWDACRSQVIGFSGAVYKSFASEEDARNFLSGTEDSPAEAGSYKGNEERFLEIYVDGSFRQDSGEFSYGMVVLSDGEELGFSGKFSDPSLSSMRNVAGEIRGAQEAMQYALEQGVSTLYLYHDYAGIAFWCTGEWKANKPGTIAYRDYYRSIANKLKVVFRKVKGHSHNRLNDRADELAKEALGLLKEDQKAQKEE